MGPANVSAKGESTLLRSESPRMHMRQLLTCSARNIESTGKKSVWNGRTPPESGYGPTPEVLDAINLNKQGLKAGIEQALKDEIMHCIEGVSVLIRCVL